MHRVWISAATVATLAIAVTFFVAACGDDATERAGTQPAPGVSTFEQGSFDDLPIYPRSDPIGPRSEKNGVVARSFVTHGATAEGIVTWYANTLKAKGWEAAGGAEQVGESTWRADFRKSGSKLRVSSAPAPTVEKESAGSGDVHDVQFSLTLRPT
jgi:hypothetical protein